MTFIWTLYVKVTPGVFKTFTLPMRERALQFCISSHNARISSSLSNPTG